MSFKSSLLIAVTGAFFTFTFMRSTSVFDPQAFGVALMMVGVISAGSDLVRFMPRRRWAVSYNNPDTVLPRGHSSHSS